MATQPQEIHSQTQLQLSDVTEAASFIAPYVSPTPQYRWPLLCEAFGGDIWLKHENHTPTGAFKVRGGLTYMRALKARGELPARFITATRGNHGQSIPYAASVYGVPVSVLVPKGNSTEKNAAMRGWGAELEVFGEDFDEAREEAERRAREGIGAMVPSFHDDLITGVATYVHELLTAQPTLHTLYVPIGMGSGVCACIRVRNLLGLQTRVVGVVAENADAIYQTFRSGQIVETKTANTFADGMACRVPHAGAVAEIIAGADDIVKVSDDEIANAMRLIFRCTHNVAEGAGAAAVAAALQGGPRDGGVAAVLTGGNVDSAVFAQVLAGETPVVQA